MVFSWGRDFGVRKGEAIDRLLSDRGPVSRGECLRRKEEGACGEGLIPTALDMNTRPFASAD